MECLRYTSDSDSAYKLDQVADTSGATLHDYTTDGTDHAAYIYAGENAIARIDQAGNASYYLEDATDSIRVVTDAAATVTASYHFDAFGNTILNSDPVQGLGYHAAWHDAAKGLRIDRSAKAFSRF